MSGGALPPRPPRSRPVSPPSRWATVGSILSVLVIIALSIAWGFLLVEIRLGGL